MPVARLPATAHLAPIRGERAVLLDGHTALAFDHDAIVARAVAWARDLYRERPDPRGPGGDEFTLRNLVPPPAGSAQPAVGRRATSGSCSTIRRRASTDPS
ncbi:hypothetical protein PA7_14680 [Pseudonocardia asaccharolytica DSM 44247 = NBRC 16224]|uniref:Uncharacterized protein n=1 Tax=Pseudonocardia asaccharolytica DSM 44247 = NBRC 16224 TaxID=1123024 RepID=A0A511CYK9_9PSEU|nr:hypothetical protein PA7_14680 [Pseudonocardia asaccharolytica DSM 44247 = NBRC 16224]